MSPAAEGWRTALQHLADDDRIDQFIRAAIRDALAGYDALARTRDDAVAGRQRAEEGERRAVVQAGVLRVELDRHRVAGDALAAAAEDVIDGPAEAHLDALGDDARAWRSVRGDAPTDAFAPVDDELRNDVRRWAGRLNGSPELFHDAGVDLVAEIVGEMHHALGEGTLDGEEPAPAAAPTDAPSAGLAAAIEIVGTPSGAMTYMAMADALGRIAEMVGLPSDHDDSEDIVSTVRTTLDRPAAAPTDDDEYEPMIAAVVQDADAAKAAAPADGQAPADQPVDPLYGCSRDQVVNRLREVIEWVSVRDHDRAVILDAVVASLEAKAALAAAPADDTAAPDTETKTWTEYRVEGTRADGTHWSLDEITDLDGTRKVVALGGGTVRPTEVRTITTTRTETPWAPVPPAAARPVRDGEATDG